MRAQRARRARQAAKRARRRAAGCFLLLLCCGAALLFAARWIGAGGPRQLFAALGQRTGAGGARSSAAATFSSAGSAPVAGAPADAAGADEGLLAGIRSRSAVLVELPDGRQIAAQNPDEPLPPASLTKLMTVYAALELPEDLGQTVTLESALFPPLWEENASMAGLLPEESVPVRDLLYGALLPSGADCCEGLAEAAGGEEVLLEEMNRIADRLGMENSRFENLTGLDAAGHRSSAADLALLLQTALKNETFRSVLTSWSYLCTDASAHPDGITFESTLLRHQDQLRGAGWEVLGGKTGFTDAAGLCLATLAEVQGEEYLLVTLGAPGASASETAHIEDAALVWSRLAEASG